MVAIDGRSFWQESPDIIRMFQDAFGDQAEARWDQEHNEAVHRDNLARQGKTPGQTGPAPQNQNPNAPLPPQQPQQAQQPQQQAGGNPEDRFPATDWDGGVLPEGTPVTDGGSRAFVIQGGKLVPVTDRGAWLAIVRNAAVAMNRGVTRAAGARIDEVAAKHAGQGQASSTGGVTAPGAPGGNAYGTDGLTPAMLQAVSQQMSQAASAAKAYSDQTGIVHEPSFDPVTQRWTYVPVNDPSTGKPMRTLDAQKFAFDIEEKAADRAYQQLLGAGFVQDPQTGQRLPTLALKQFEEGQRQFNTTFGENQRQFNVNATGYLDGLPTLERERFGLEVARVDSANKANPRNYIEASMFNPGARGGLGGFAPNNQLPPGLQQAAETFRTMQAGRTAGQSTPQTNAGIAPTPPAAAGAAGAGGEMQAHGGVPAPLAGLPGLGQPGAPDHIASRRPDGTIEYYGVPNAAGGFDIPITAATRALLEGRPIPGYGAVAGPTGGWARQTDVQRAADPNQAIAADYYRMTPSEQAQARATYSLAGFSDEDSEAAIKKGLPGAAASTSAGAVLPFKWGAAA